MEYYRDELIEPVSPMGQCFNSSVWCINILAVLEFEVPIDDLQIASILGDGLLMNPRFSPIMVNDKNGKKIWKQVEVKLEEHIITPKFPDGMSTDSYDKCFNDYSSSLAMDQLPQNKPLWEVHVIIHPKTKSFATLMFKVNHALGDGYSLMGFILSYFERVDNPSLPLTFPSIKRSRSKLQSQNIFMRLHQLASTFLNFISGFKWRSLKIGEIEDDKTPIRSGDEGVEFRRFVISNLEFSIDIEEIKSKLVVTLNDVITGIIFYGIRLYMQDVDYSSREARSTALVGINTRNVERYQSVKNMVNKDAKGTWGNKSTMLRMSLPKLKDAKVLNPLQFILKAHANVQRKRNSLAVRFSHKLIFRILQKFGGQEAVAKNIHSNVRKSSLVMSNMAGPVDQIALDNHPLKSLYFTFTGEPKSLAVIMMSYMGVLRVTFKTEEGFINEQKLKSRVKKAFQIMLKAARDMPTATGFNDF